MSERGTSTVDDRAGRPIGPTGHQMAAMAWTIACRPRLWGAAVGALGRLAAPGWWRHPPYLPVPDAALWEFRMVTAYGDDHAGPEPDDLISYLQWCRSTARGQRTQRSGHGRSPRRRDPARSG